MTKPQPQPAKKAAPHLPLDLDYYDCSTDPSHGGLPPYSDSALWNTAVRKQAKLCKQLGEPERLPHRHDFRGSRRYWTPALAHRGVSGSPEMAVLCALRSGRTNLADALSSGSRKVQAEYLMDTAAKMTRAIKAYSLPEIIAAGVRLGLVTAAHHIDSVDQLICELATGGSCVVSLPVYPKMYRIHRNNVFATVREGEPLLGYTAMCVTGYSANGMILELRHNQPETDIWSVPILSMTDDQFVRLMAAGGECYSIVRPKIFEATGPMFRKP